MYLKNIEQDMREAFRVSVRIKATDGSTISLNDDSLFAKPEFPENIESIYISTPHRFANIFPGCLPRNYIEIFLDFRRMPIALNLINLPSNPTPNESNFYLNGLDEGWIDSTFMKIESFFDKLRNNRSVIHRSGVYDIFLYVGFVPFALFWMMKIESIFLNRINELNPTFLTIFVYRYIIMFFGVIARLLFQYTRWVFPSVEYISAKRTGPMAHRALLAFMSFTIIYPLAIELAKWIIL
jgi:hypothetical protein